MVSGFAVMGCYEIVRVLRALFHLKTVGKFILDTIYFLVAAVLVFQMVFLCNYGDAADFFWHRFCTGSGGLSCRAGKKRVAWYSSGDLGNTPKNNTTLRSKM